MVKHEDRRSLNNVGIEVLKVSFAGLRILKKQRPAEDNRRKVERKEDLEQKITS